MQAVDGYYDYLELQDKENLIYDDDGDEEETTTAATSTAPDKDPRKTLLRSDMRNKRVGVAVGLFCAVLSLLIIVVPLYLYQSNMAERGQLAARYDQLQARTDNLTEERDRLQNGFDRLRSRHDNLTGQNGQLQSSFDRLQTRQDRLTAQKDQLQAGSDRLQSRFDRLQTAFDELRAGSDRLQAGSEGLRTALDRLRASFAQLQTRHDNLTEQKGQLQTSFDRLQVGFFHLQSSFDQLVTRHDNVTEERDDLRMRLCESPGWQKLNSSCYYISTETKPWEESRQWCRDRQSDLIVISSQEKQDFVERVNKRVWLGLTDREGSFKWVDGTSLTTPTYWRRWEPSKNGHCVEFYDGALPAYPERGWDDKPCSNNYQWICERVMD